jgi:hypothetical protein
MAASGEFERIWEKEVMIYIKNQQSLGSLTQKTIILIFKAVETSNGLDSTLK